MKIFCLAVLHPQLVLHLVDLYPLPCQHFEESSKGSLEPGKRADLIVVNMSAARQTPVYDPVSQIVYTTRGDDVRTTIVHGKVLMRDRKVLTLDEAKVLASAREWAKKVREAVQQKS